MISWSVFLTSGEQRYLELKRVAVAQGQVSGDGHTVPVGATEHHGRGRRGAETVVAFSLHAFVAQHQPHAHLVQRVVEGRLLVEVLSEGAGRFNRFYSRGWRISLASGQHFSELL